MTTNFIRGMDLSLFQHLEDRGVPYEEAGEVKDPLLIFRDHGVNFVRLRLFVDPDGTEGQVNTLPYTVALAGRVKDAGLGLLLDFHYSDFWADPLHQTIPATWAALSLSQIEERIFDHTHDALAALTEAGSPPDMVQVGNEITNGMVWPAAGPLADAARWNELPTRRAWPEGDPHPAAWDALAAYLKPGIRAVQEWNPDGTVPVMLHVDKGGGVQMCRRFFDALAARAVVFDVIGLSYYPFWHGSLEDLSDNLASLSEAYHKDIVVVETGYDWNGGEQGSLPFPLTPDGQKSFVEEILQRVAAVPQGQGVFYWAPEWIGGPQWNGPDWSKTWENRALFDETGEMLPGLQAFNL